MAPMSENDLVNDSDMAPAESVPPPAPAPRGRGIAAALALLLALLALLASAGGGWYLWQLEQGRAAGAARLQDLSSRVSALDARLAEVADQRGSLRKRLGDAEAVNQSLREQVLGLSERASNLEDAVANLSRRTLSGHDAMLLDEAELLLRLGKARYTLFGDASGALAAYAQADKALASVDDPAFSGVRQTLDAERKALAATHPERARAELDALAQLRSRVLTLPLKSLDAPSTAPAKGLWTRVTHALSGLVRIERDRDAPLSVADGRLARELAQLDLVQAESARLAHDQAGYRAALKRADASLAAYFDASAAPVQAARQQIAGWLAERVVSAPELGSALDELRNLRQVRAAKPAPSPKAASEKAGAKP